VTADPGQPEHDATEGGDPAGIRTGPVTAWLAEHVGTVAPLRFERLAGGHSNLTYRIDDAEGNRVVLRRPPEGDLLPTAHDMGREHRLIDALGPTDVPVPEALATCTDPSVTGAPFYVMAHVDGVVLHTAADAESAFGEAERAAIGRDFVDVLARLHAVDPDAVGLGDLSRKEDYIARQLKTWWRQYEASRTADDPLLGQVHEWLQANIPEQGPARVVHGDFRLGNTITGPDARIAAVLDWEIATLGDPLADLGYVLATWPRPGDGLVATTSATSMAAGFPERDELLDTYADATGADLAGIDYYVAWANWKTACIVQGVYRRYLDGQLSTAGVDVEGFRRTVEAATALAAEAIERIGSGGEGP
jgi:aminoglycoside phosphotransferase (APT) family kinase protein